MKYRSKALLSVSTIVLVSLLSACSPEIGSKEWCNDLDEVKKTEWTDNEALNYAKYCLIQSKD